MRIGVQLHPQHTTVEALRQAARDADALGVDSIWTWDHFYPLYGDPDGAHFEGWSLLAAFACDTERARIGPLVSCTAYRNPDLLADLARTVDHIAGGRLVLGLGAGWFERDFHEYGYPFLSPALRIREFEVAVRRIRRRLRRLRPGPAGPLPILIGGRGRRLMLRIVAELADAWNSFGPPEQFAELNRVLDRWCERVGRDPAAIERTVLIRVEELDRLEAYEAAGADLCIVQLGHPFDLGPVAEALAGR